MKIFRKKTRHPLVRIFILLIVVGAIAFLYFDNIKKASAEWFDQNWYYREAVNISNAGTAQTDYQVSITLDTVTLYTAGKIQSDCDDIRITDTNGKVLPHWIETTTCNTATTAIWTKVPSLPTSGQTVYVYYGNPNATNIENGNNVFLLFDDFSGTTLNTNKWTTNLADAGTSISVSGGMLTFTLSNAYQHTGGSVISKNSLASGDYATITKVKFTDYYASAAGAHAGFTNSNSSFEANYGNPTNLTSARLWDYPSQVKYLSAADTNIGSTNDTTALTIRNLWFRMQSLYLYTAGTQSITGKWDQLESPFVSRTLQKTGTGGLQPAYVSVGVGDYATNETTTFDFIGVRKYTTTEPMIGSTGSEEKGPAPVAYWRFDEGQGSATFDESSNNNDGTISGATWQTGDMCVAGKCLKFDGSDDYVDIANESNFDFLTTAGNSISAEAWFKTTDSANQQVILTKGTSVTNNFRFRVVAGKVGALFSTDPSNYKNPATIKATFSDGKWHHAVVVVENIGNSMTITFYVDGVLEANDGGTLGTYTPGTNNYNLRIGYHQDSTLPFNGFIDDVKIYPYARTAAQIKTDYSSRGSTSGVGAQIGNQSAWMTNGLVGYWKMDEASGTLADSSGSSNTGTWYGTGASHYTGGKFGNGGGFNGTDDYVRDADATLNISDKITIEAWMKGAVDASAQQSYANLVTITGGAKLYASVSNYITARVESTYLSSGIQSVANQWYHVVMTYDRENIKIYVDGQFKNSTPLTSAMAVDTEQTDIGWDAAGGTGARHFNGLIDEVRIYNRALSPKEISDLYNFAPGPVGWWKMDDKVSGNSQTLVDSSTYGNTATTYYGANTTGMNCKIIGKYGSGCLLDGIDDYVNVPYTATYAPNTISIGAWFNTSDKTASSRIVSKTQTGGYQISLSENSGCVSNTLCMIVYVGGTYYDATYAISNLNNNQWYYVAGTYDGETVRLYLNGIEVGSDTGPSGNIMYTQNNPLCIGSEPDASVCTVGTYFKGSIDDVRIYNYARTQKQIMEDMNAGHPSVGSPVGSYAAYWKFDEGHDNTLYDMSVNANTGTNHGASWINDGKFGKALSFNGISSYVSCGSSASITSSLNTFTITAWIKTADTGSNLIVGFEPTGSSYPVVGPWSSNRLIIYMGANNYKLFSSANVTDNQWHQVAFIVPGNAQTDITNSKAFADGKELSVDSTVSSGTQSSKTACVIAAGSSVDTGWFYSGSIDEVKIYPFALTADEIKTEYNHSAATKMGTFSDTSNITGGSVASNSASALFCIPGDTATCNPPVGEWKMDENVTGNSQTLYDTSSQGNNGTTYYGANLTGMNCKVLGKYATGCQFDGVDDYITTSDNSIFNSGASGAFTYEMWIKAGNYSTLQSIMSRRNDCNNEGTFNIYVQSNRVYFAFYSDLDSLTITHYSDAILTNGNMYHIVWVKTWGQSGVKLYINGVSQTVNGDATARGTSYTLPIYIGAQNGGSGCHGPASNFYNGLVDQIQIFNYARTSAQVVWDYNRGGPIGYWKFDECQGATAYDQSDNNNDGAITIGATVPQTTVGTCTTPTDGTGAWYNGLSGKMNSSLGFDGIDDYVTMGDVLDIRTNDLTLEAWIKPSTVSPAANMYAVGKSDSSSTDGRYAMGVSTDGKVRAVFDPGTGLVFNGNTPLTTNWNHVVLVYDRDGNLSIYVNGIYDTGQSIASGNGNNYNTVIPFIIGAYTPTSSFFSGLIDDVKIYNYALTPQQIKLDYNQGSAVRFGPNTGRP